MQVQQFIAYYGRYCSLDLGSQSPPVLVYAALICPLNKQHSFTGGDILDTASGVLFIWKNEFCCFIKAKTKLSVCVVSRPISPWSEKVWVMGGGDQNNSILLGHKIPAGAETQSLWESKNRNQSSVCLATILCVGTAPKNPAKLWAQNMSESEGQVNWEKLRSSGHQTAGSVKVWLLSFLSFIKDLRRFKWWVFVSF